MMPAKNNFPLFLCFSTSLLLLSLACQPAIVCPDYPEPELVSQFAQETGLKQKSGYLNGNTGQLFYWLIEAANPTQETPLVIWLNGGPGSSSLVGLLAENGPFTLEPNLTLTPNEYSWHTAAHILYIDQPVGTGYSIAQSGDRFSRDEKQVADNFFAALVNFYNANPSFVAQDLYIAGESFAGTYIPHMALKIVDFNEQNKAGSPPEGINLIGISIGDGTVDSLQSWQTQPQYALDNNLIGEAEYHYQVEKLWPLCQDEINESRKQNTPHSVDACWEMQARTVDQTGVNVYDIRRTGSYRFDPLSCFLNDTAVMAENGALQAWNEDNQQVFGLLKLDDNLPTTDEISTLLHKNIKVLIYNGDQDLIINHLGTEAWLDALDYSFFSTKNLTPWMVDSELLGHMTKADNLTYVRVVDAGHLVPKDQPETGLELLKMMLGNK